MKKVIFIGFLFVFLPVSFAKAAVVFTEVMYDPAGTDDKHEWVEVFNNGTSAVDMTKYFLQTDGVGSSYHAITSVGSTTLLPAGAYAIIAQDAPTFSIDQTGFSGILFDSSWSDLSDSAGKTLVINDANKTALDQYTYDPSIGASNDGNSLQKNSSDVWVSALPTPGFATYDTSTNNTSSSTEENTSAQSGSTSANDTSSTNTATSSVIYSSTPIPTVQLVVPRTVIAGVPVNINYSVSGTDTIPLNSKTFRVSLGDGAEHYDYSQNVFSHVYAYPGTYVVYFEYMQNPYNINDPKNLSIRRTIEVLPSPVVISDTNIDGSVEISNPEAREVDISGWILRSLSNPLMYFTIPDNTIILPGKKIIFSKDITGFVYENIQTLELSLPSGVSVAVYDGSDTSLGGNTQENSVSDTVETSYANTQAAPTSQVAVIKKSTNISNNSGNVHTANYSATLSQGDVDSQVSSTGTGTQIQAEALSSINTTDSQNHDSFPFVPVALGFAGVVIVSLYTIKTLNASHVNGGQENDADRIRIIED